MKNQEIHYCKKCKSYTYCTVTYHVTDHLKKVQRLKVICGTCHSGNRITY